MKTPSFTSVNSLLLGALAFITVGVAQTRACDSFPSRTASVAVNPNWNANAMADLSPAALVASAEGVQSNYWAVFLLANAAGSNSIDAKVAAEIASQYRDITTKSNLALKFVIQKGCVTDEQLDKLKKMIVINQAVGVAASHVLQFLDSKDVKEGQAADQALAEALSVLEVTFPKGQAVASSRGRSNR